MRAGSGPRRADRGPFRGFERARADHAEPIRHRASRRREIVERTRVPHVRTFEGPSAFRFAAHFLVAEPSVGKNRATREKESRSDQRSGDGTYGLQTAAKSQLGVSLRIASRGNPHKPSRERFGDDEPEPIARGAANDEGWRVPGKPARPSVKKTRHRLASRGRRERAHRGVIGRENPRDARLSRAPKRKAAPRPVRRTKNSSRAAFARLRRGRERPAMAKHERREYCRTRAHLRKTAFQPRSVVPFPETTSLTPARPLCACTSPSSARDPDPSPCHRRR